jgi:hypothetical protein
VSLLETRQRAFNTKLSEGLEKLKSMDSRSGFVYVAVNSCWPEISKIGSTKDPIKRIKSFNTYDPYMGFKLVSFKLVDDRWEYEKSIHEILSEYRMNSEWFNIPWTQASGVLHSPDKKDIILGNYILNSEFRCRGEPSRKASHEICKSKMLKLTKHGLV